MRYGLSGILLAVLVMACTRNGDDTPSDSLIEVSPVTFVDVTIAAGIDIGESEWGTYGVAWGDYDNDGYADLFIHRKALIPVLYHNNGDGSFSDVTIMAGLDAGISVQNLNLYDRHACAWGDYDADTLLDLFCAAGAEAGKGTVPNQLFHNQGDGTFREVAGQLGVSDGPNRGRAVNWLDYDRDGFLDLYVTNNRRSGYPSRLYRGLGGTFEDAPSDAGLNEISDVLFGAGTSWADFDADGDSDLIVSTFTALVLHVNRGDGTFTSNQAQEAGLSTDRVRSVSWADADNDGDLDLFVARIGEGARFYINIGAGRFQDATAASGLDVDGAAVGVWGDIDNDGDLDLFVVREYSPEIGENLPDALFINNGDATFYDVATSGGIVGPQTGAGDSAAFADYNNDGFLDLLVTNGAWYEEEPDGLLFGPLSDAESIWPGRARSYARVPEGPATLFLNGGNSNHWLELRLRSASGNTFGYGTKVWLTIGDELQFRQLTDGVAQISQSDSIVHYGLGSAETVDELIIQWPNGQRQTLTNIEADQILMIEQPVQD